MKENWHQVAIVECDGVDKALQKSANSDEKISFLVDVTLGDINPSNIKVELFYGIVGINNTITNPKVHELENFEHLGSNVYRYYGEISIKNGGEYGYTYRIIPSHPQLSHKFDLSLIQWAK